MSRNWPNIILVALSLIFLNHGSFALAKDGADSSGGEPPKPLGGPAVVAFKLPDYSISMVAFQKAIRTCYTRQYDYKTIKLSTLDYLLRIATMGFEMEWSTPIDNLEFDLRTVELGEGTSYPFPKQALGPVRFALLPKGSFKRGEKNYSFIGRLFIGTYGSGFCGEFYSESRSERCVNTRGGDVVSQIALSNALDSSSGAGATSMPAYRSFDPETGIVDLPVLVLSYGLARNLEKSDGIDNSHDSYVACMQQELAAAVGAKDPLPLELVWRKYKAHSGH